MSKIFTKAIFTLLVFGFTGVMAQAQNVTISGVVTDKSTNEPISGVGVTVKGKLSGTSTNSNGRFSLTTAQKTPFTIVLTYVGYTAVEKEITGSASDLNFALESATILGQEVVVSASRTPERILESPVSIERMGQNVLKEISAPSFYDALSSMKGVETSAQSLTFKSINTRGFNSNGNTRFNQFVDGMDNQAPGLNFSVGNIIGISDLDLDHVELLPGAASALYGAGGINGTMLMTSKSPFDYQGSSFSFKTGVNHLNDNNTGNQQYNQLDVRMAKAWSRFAVKGTFSFLQAKDWQADNYSNFDRAARTVKGGDRASDPNYDGVNVYGDEVNTNVQGVARIIQSTFAAQQPLAYGAFNTLVSNPLLNYATILNVINTNPSFAALRPAMPQLAPYLGVMYGLNRNTISSQNVSRTGYDERNLVDYNTESLKASGSLHYKLTPTIEAIAQASWGKGTSVYTGSDRYSLRNFNIGQYKLELKGEDFFVRGYTTQERSGDSYISSILGSYMNETWSRSREQWFPTYTLAYSSALAAGQADAQAHTTARATADQGRFVPGSTQYADAKNKIINTTIASTDFTKGIYGAKFNDKTNLYHYEGMYNLSNALNQVVEFQLGGSYRLYQLRSGGTIFDDLNREIDIDEYGVFGQLGKKFLADKLKFTVSGRYDKSENFEGRFTPRVTGVFTVAPNNNIRVSYQAGYRNPTTQNQYIDLTVGGGSQRLVGGLPESLDKYNLLTNKPFTDKSYRDYQLAVATSPSTAPAQPATVYNFDARGVRPESVQAFEVGYKGLLGSKFLLDAYVYHNTYKDFITAVEVYQKNANNADYTKFGVPVNATGEVTSYGAALGIDYLLGRNYNLSGNVSYNEIGDLPADYINDFNTPTIRYNLGLGNKQIVRNVGFNVNYRWQDAFYWTSSFSSGDVPAFSTLDAQVNLKIPSVNSMIKIGGSNILNKYYFTSYGNPAVGALYYIGFAYNP